MIKPELVRNIVNRFEVGETEAALLVDNIFTAMLDALSKGKNINIPEFGKFKIVYRMINGIRVRCVTFSPVRKFAEFINEDFNNLDSHITKVLSLKNSDILTVRELMPDENDEEYLCFIFEDKHKDVISSEISNAPEVTIENKFKVQSGSEKHTEDISEVVSEKNKDKAFDALPGVVSNQTVDNEKVFELPETRRKIVHNLKDDFSIDGTDDTDLSFSKEDIIEENNIAETWFHDITKAGSRSLIKKSEDDVIISSNADDIIIPFNRESGEISIKEQDIIHEHPKIDIQTEKPEEEDDTDELTKSIIKLEQSESKEVDRKQDLTLQKSLTGESKLESEISTIESDVIISHEEPKSLDEALENLQIESQSVLLDSDKSKEPSSFNEIFVTKEQRYGIKPPSEKKKVKKINGAIKVLFYILFVIMFGIICFYVFDIIFNKSDNKGKTENIRKPTSDTLNKQFANDEKVKGESVQVEIFNGAVYRKLGAYFYIEYNLYNSINEASDKEAKLKSNMISCKVEAVMTVENTIEYRVLVGPFETIDDAKDYHKEYKSIMESVK